MDFHTFNNNTIKKHKHAFLYGDWKQKKRDLVKATTAYQKMLNVAGNGCWTWKSKQTHLMKTLMLDCCC